MEPLIKLLPEKKLIGKKLQMSFANNQTPGLWGSFMRRRQEVKNRLNEDLISMQIYPLEMNLQQPDPNLCFEKWACTEVFSLKEIPPEMFGFTLQEGLYAIFHYKGLNTGVEVFKYIFSSWLPQSNFVLDHRPHFEIIGAKYKNNDPTSEEEICIPLRRKLSKT
jgi:AraC family transcriptional regulator